MSFNACIAKDAVHIYNGISLSPEKEQNNAICSHMDGPGDYHTKRSKSKDLDKCHINYT